MRQMLWYTWGRDRDMLRILLITCAVLGSIALLLMVAIWIIGKVADWLMPDVGNSPHDRLLYEQYERETGHRLR